MEMQIQASTRYRVEAFGPIEWGELRRKFHTMGLLWPAMRFDAAAVRRNGDLFVPIGAIVEAVRQMPAELEAWLYSRPLWVDNFSNLVVTTGLTDLLDKYLKGSSYTAAHYVGLAASSPTFAAGDTMSSHGGWTEVTAYSQSTRVAPTWGTVTSGSVDNSASKAVFSINGTATAGGAFLTTNSTKGGSTGTLYGGGAFSEGNRSVVNGDTLNVTITATATAS